LALRSRVTFKDEAYWIRATRCRLDAPRPFECGATLTLFWRSERGSTVLAGDGACALGSASFGSISIRQFHRGAPPDVAILADARGALAALVAALGAKSPQAAARTQAIAKVKAEVAAEFDRSLAPQMSFLRAIREASPEDTVFVADYTQVAYVATAALPVSAPRQMITPGYQGSLGFAFATALGAKVSCPDKPVVAQCGDGGFLFTANELATAVQHNIRTVTIVFNDGGYGNVRRMQEDLNEGRVIASDLKNPDFVRFAESFRRRCAPRRRTAGTFGGPALGV
jgi:thiamine pyrophosphate-dependent acetolactate synthase large subunit-like protein